ncbi:glycoside hydrolase/deacetylase [Artomyces pyxidatus]|uniref:Glycoside hydrolase/deacetylase n=1 Tax=Artomyces pyxidatus TaxID=48021 RepID=A0ACB8TJV4_9AGAM|nr:glycoside hydrolase/deacetylase [Artomyces pyxidatus]
MFSTLLVLAAAASAVSAHAHHPSRDVHAHHARAPLPAAEWYHPRDHPTASLFRRQNAAVSTDGATYPQVGSPTWTAAYPVSTPDSNAMPQAWKDALNAAIAAGLIPAVPPTSGAPDANPTYAAGYDPMSPQVCSATYKCRLPGDIWDAPEGVIGIGFDDGPLPPSDRLYSFLQQNKIKATHFFIGVNIVNNPKEFLLAINQNQDDIAVHTWTHPHMTELTSMDVVAQIGWTMQIIHDSTGGRVPRFWRPPYGDTDARVSAIAKEVFGLTTIIWNQDSEDWTLTTNGTTPQAIATNMHNWLTGPKTPGLIILEHELSDQSVQAFMDNFPLIAANGWKPVSVVETDGQSKPYQNAVGSTGAVTSANILVGASSAPPLANTTSSTASSTASSAPVSSTPVVSSAAPSVPPSSASASTSPTPVAGANQASSNGAAPIALPSAVYALVAVAFGLLG